MKHKKVLMVFIEPTPYIFKLIEKISSIWEGELDVVFLKENVSQNWNLEKKFLILPTHFGKAIKILYRKCSNNQYSLIFIAGWGNLICLLLILILRLIGIPTVVDSDTTLSLTTPLWKRAIKRICYPILFKFPNLFLPAGTRQAKYLQYYGVKPEKIIIERMTVDILAMQKYVQNLPINYQKELRAKIGLYENDIVFLFVGRLLDWKGIRELVSAFGNLKNCHAKLLIVGDGPMNDYVQAAAAMYKNRIYYAGRIIGNMLIEYYFISDIFVLPSHHEPWGLVINEAMAVGKPVIVSDQVGCVDDLVIHKKTGLIVKPKCVDSLMDAMQYFCKNRGNYRIMSQEVLRHISGWTLEDEVKCICSAWKNLV